jgi:S-adenosylmethionine hydrolase
VAIVDPGVGSDRRGVILKTPSALFVSPDNGILSYIVDDLLSVDGQAAIEQTQGLTEVVFKKGLEAAAITDPRFWRHPVSPTFHGRDIFAPVAAGLSLGISPFEFGEKINSLHVLPIVKPSLDSDGNTVGQVLHVDRFGNLITNIRSNSLLAKNVTIDIGGRRVQGISDYYAQGEGIMAVAGSSGYLEISLRDGSACDFLDVGLEEEVRVISTE